MDRYEAIFQSGPDGILVVDPEGVIRDANPEALRLFGYSKEALVGSGVDRLVPARLRPGHAEVRERYRNRPEPRPMGIGLELEGARADGTSIPLEISLSPFEEAGASWTIAMVRDVSERRRLRRFGRDALQVAEEERRRIARELHDDTAQALAGLLVRLRVLEKSADARRRDELIAEMHEQVTVAVEGVRRISRGLRPPALQDAGVVAAIRAHGREVEASSPLRVVIDSDSADPVLSEDERLVVYRVAQEAMTNVVRHAGATEVRVCIRLERGEVQVEVSDDGRGFDPDASARGDQGLGLTGMVERARAIGGSLELESVPGRGTSVRLRFVPSGLQGSDG